MSNVFSLFQFTEVESSDIVVRGSNEIHKVFIVELGYNKYSVRRQEKKGVTEDGMLGWHH